MVLDVEEKVAVVAGAAVVTAAVAVVVEIAAVKLAQDLQVYLDYRSNYLEK